MSTKPPATGRVKSMRNRFENLNSLEHFEALTINLPKTEVTNPTKTFRRSATSFELFVPKKFGNLNCNNNHHRRPTTLTTATAKDAAQDNVRKHLNHVKETNGSIKTNETIFKLPNGCNNKNSNSKPPLTEITENVSQITVPSRLIRHTSDPVKRGSIKRSPAFRVGDKHSPTTRPKILSPAGVTQPVANDELSERIESLLKRSVTESKIIYQPGITDTLKAALKQPLPTGPPPKKPPRAFLDSPSPKEELSTISMFEAAAESTSIPFINNKLKSKIKFLQNNLHLNKCIESRPPLSPPHTSNSIFGCIPSCTATAVYDSVRIYSDEVIKEKPDNPAEHIYMEPYGHLKAVPESPGDCDTGMRSTDTISSLFHRNDSHISESSMDSFASGSGCACPEDHSAENEDLHYLVSRRECTVVKWW